MCLVYGRMHVASIMLMLKWNVFVLNVLLPHIKWTQLAHLFQKWHRVKLPLPLWHSGSSLCAMFTLGPKSSRITMLLFSLHMLSACDRITVHPGCQTGNDARHWGDIFNLWWQLLIIEVAALGFGLHTEMSVCLNVRSQTGGRDELCFTHTHTHWVAIVTERGVRRWKQMHEGCQWVSQLSAWFPWRWCETTTHFLLEAPASSWQCWCHQSERGRKSVSGLDSADFRNPIFDDLAGRSMKKTIQEKNRDYRINACLNRWLQLHYQCNSPSSM